MPYATYEAEAERGGIIAGELIARIRKEGHADCIVDTVQAELGATPVSPFLDGILRDLGLIAANL